MRTLVVSCHMDDAILSCGQYLDATRDHDTYVWTALAGYPPPGTATGYDTSTGWTDSEIAIAGRRQEDERALTRLGAIPIWGPLLDGQYGDPVDPADVAHELLYSVLGDVEPDLVIIPIGIRHPDHIAVADGCLQVVAIGAAAEHVLFYEDMPYWVMYPDEAVDRVRRAATVLDGRLSSEAQPAGDIAVKQEAVAQYRSQMIALEPDLRCCWVPERFHRVTS